MFVPICRVNIFIIRVFCFGFCYFFYSPISHVISTAESSTDRTDRTDITAPISTNPYNKINSRNFPDETRRHNQSAKVMETNKQRQKKIKLTIWSGIQNVLQWANLRFDCIGSKFCDISVVQVKRRIIRRVISITCNYFNRCKLILARLCRN